MQLKKTIKHIIGIIIFSILFSNAAISQTDSISTDSIKNKNVKKPVVAVTLSAVVPGAGQIYNGKWYKVPFIYAALGGSYYAFNYYSKLYSVYITDLYYLQIDSTYIPITKTTDIGELTLKKNQFRRSRDLAFLGGILIWSLNIIDAYVDAELSDFDVSPDLTLNIYPQVYSFNNRNTYALTFSLKF